MTFTVIVTQLPFIATLIISFRNWNTNHPERYGWAGFKNYKRVFTDSQLLKYVWHTVELTVVVVLVSLIFGLGIALLLNRSFPGRGIVRTLMIAPFLIVPVAAALFFKFGMFDPNTGLLNGIITMVHRWFDPGAPRVLHRFHRNASDALGGNSIGLAMDAVHDVDPAGRSAVPTRRGSRGGVR